MTDGEEIEVSMTLMSKVSTHCKVIIFDKVSLVLFLYKNMRKMACANIISVLKQSDSL